MQPSNIPFRPSIPTLERRFHARRAHIVIADSDPLRRSHLADAVREAGAVALEVRNGGELLDRIASQVLVGQPKPDAIVASVDLEGFSGMSIADGLRGTDWEVPVILVAPTRDRHSTIRALHHGALAVVRESHAEEELQTLIRRLGPPSVPGLRRRRPEEIATTRRYQKEGSHHANA